MPARVRVEDRECPLSTAMGYIGEWWTILILHDCFDGYTRFDQFEANIGLSSSMLTTRLKTLVEKGVLSRQAYQDHPTRYEYLLTEFGRSLRPILVAMAAWRNAQLAPEDRAMILIDTRTGREVHPVVVDPETGDPATGPRFAFTAGPAAGPQMRERYRPDSPSARADRSAPASE